MPRVVNQAVWIESQQCWQIKVRKDGQRKTFRSYKKGRAGKIECQDRAKSWKEDGIINGNTKLSKLSESLIEELKISTSKSNWHNYQNYVNNYVNPVKGNKKTSSVTEQDLQDIILYAFKHPVRGGQLAAKTLKNIMDFLKLLMKYARKNNATLLYPENLYIPKTAKKSNKGTLQPDDLIKLFSSNKTTDHKKIIDEWYINAFRYAAVTGHRPGELFGLQVSDIKSGVCKCNRSINIYGEITDGKNENARRSYVIPALGLDILKDQKRMLKKAGVISPYIFPSPDGNPIIYNTFYKHWFRYRTHNKISDCTLYEIRHTWFSVNKELPIELVKAMGGHGQDFDTMGTYGHALSGEAQKTARLINDKFREILKKDSENTQK